MLSWAPLLVFGLQEREPEAGLPALLRFDDGLAVQAAEDWPARREEVRRAMLRTFTGAPPEEVPAIIEVEELSSKRTDDGATRRVLRLGFDTPSRCSFELHVWRPAGEGPFPLLLTQPRGYQMAWAEEASRRGFVVCLYPGLDSHHREADFPGYDSVWQQFRSEYPTADWTEIVTKAWLASRSLDYLLSPRSGAAVDPTAIGIIGHSRYGKQSLIAAAFDERITAVLARSPGSPASCPYRFTSRDTFAEAPADFPGEWFLPSLRGYTGREHELPMDAHGWAALVAPRPLLFHTALNDGAEPTFAVERGYLAAKEVYRLLGHEENLFLDYRDGAHNPITAEHVRRNLDWFEAAFGRAEDRRADFPERLLHRFDRAAWRAAQRPADLATDLRGAGREQRVARVRWLLGEAPPPADGEPPPLLTAEESAMMTHDRWTVQGVRRTPVSFGAGVRGNLYAPDEPEGALPVVVWLHPFSYHSGYNEGYGVQGTTVYHRLASEGYAVIAYDQCGFGLRLREGARFDEQTPRWSRLGCMVEDVRAAVDFVHGAGRPDARSPALDSGRVFLVGYSLGGMVALHAAALDPRVTGVASFSGLAPWRWPPSPGSGGNRRWSDWHALVPKLALFEGREEEIPADFDDLLRLVAPRPCLVVAPTRDRDHEVEAVRACVDRARDAWPSDGLVLETPDDVGRFQRDQHQRVLEWLAGLTSAEHSGD